MNQGSFHSQKHKSTDNVTAVIASDLLRADPDWNRQPMNDAPAPSHDDVAEDLLIKEAEEFLSKEPVGAAVGHAGGGRKTIRLTDQSTGKIIEATIDTDEQGNIVNVVPVEPLDPNKDYGVGPSSR